MKKISLVLILFISSMAIYGQSMDKVLRKYRNDDGVISLNFAGDMSRFMKTSNVKLKSKVTSCDVLIFNEPNDIKPSDYAKIKSNLSSKNFEQLISVKDKRGKANIHIISKGETISEVFAIVSAEKRNMYVTLTGTMYLEELGKLNMFFDGGNDLSKFLK